MKEKKLYIALIILSSVAVVAATAYLFYQNYRLQEDNVSLMNQLSQTRKELFLVKADFASTTLSLNSLIRLIEEELSGTIIERDDFAQKYSEEKARMDYLSSQITGIEGQIGILEKLIRTDKELLQKYSKVYFLNENYVPATFVKIDSGYTYDTSKDYLIYASIWQFTKDMMDAAKNAGNDIKIISAYRSFGSQADLKSTYEIYYGSGANAFVADQGYSEHQLGTTLDFTTSKIGATYTGFEKTATYQWLLQNAYKYGFILSYPADNHYYQFEPWHWRFVGRTLAGKLHQEGMNFYSLDQRTIDEYLISFFD